MKHTSALVDITGQTFGNWTVLQKQRRQNHNPHDGAYYLCKCICGTEKVVSGRSLRSGKTKSCGCAKPNRSKLNLLNQRFGHLVAVKQLQFLNKTDNGMGTLWLCKCDCGNEIQVTGRILKHYKRHCGCVKRTSSLKLPFGEASVNRRFCQLRNTAKRKGLSLEITLEKFKQLTQQNCYYCGAEPVKRFDKSSENGVIASNGLDRIDSTQGYTLKNIVPCCSNCNYAKRSLTQEQFKTIIKRIYHHWCEAE